MRYRIVSGDAGGIRGVVELEASGYSVTQEGTLIVMGEKSKVCEFAPGAWRSIVDTAAFAAALKGGTSDEVSRNTKTTYPPAAS